MEHLGAIPEPSWPIMPHLGHILAILAIWDPFWTHFGPMWDPFWSHFGTSFDPCLNHKEVKLSTNETAKALEPLGRVGGHREALTILYNYHNYNYKHNYLREFALCYSRHPEDRRGESGVSTALRVSVTAQSGQSGQSVREWENRCPFSGE